ncbi:MAG: class IV adenylate cyclase [Candidatus Thermofonsia bacterium]|nr:MAG: class IV adenylate cyclase [Candidatus Thermofonsia bacterium]
MRRGNNLNAADETAVSKQHLEVEVKFLVSDLAALHDRVLGIGAVLVKPRVFERNLRLDTADSLLLRQRQLLRLRQDTAVTLTFKAEPTTPHATEAKVREELEIQVSDLDTAAAIFGRLGFQPVQIYEKYRTTYQWQHVEIVLDELPFGSFIELEGPEQEIKKAASALKLVWDGRLLTNYLALMAAVQQHYNLPFSDLTFENFKNTTISLADVIKQQ